MTIDITVQLRTSPVVIDDILTTHTADLTRYTIYYNYINTH